MPVLAIELPQFLSPWFPAEPIRIGWFVLQRRSIAAQHEADAATVEHLAQKIRARDAAAADGAWSMEK